MVHIDTSNPTRRPQQPNIITLRLWLRNSADVVGHATNNMCILTRLTQHVSLSNPLPWHCITSSPTVLTSSIMQPQSLPTHHYGVANTRFHSHMTQYLSAISQVRLSLAMPNVWACTIVSLCTTHILFITFIHFSSAHPIILTQYLFVYTTCLKISWQWPAHCGELQTHCSEIQPRCSEIQPRCSGEHPQIRYSDMSLLAATKITLIAISALCLNQIEHGVQNSNY